MVLLTKRLLKSIGESGFYKTDKLLPVITLVIFWGAEKWDAPLSLKEMYAEADETIMKYVPDYKVNLTSSSKFSASMLRKHKRWVGTYLFQWEYKLPLKSCDSSYEVMSK